MSVATWRTQDCSLEKGANSNTCRRDCGKREIFEPKDLTMNEQKCEALGIQFAITKPYVSKVGEDDESWFSETESVGSTASESKPKKKKKSKEKRHKSSSSKSCSKDICEGSVSTEKISKKKEKSRRSKSRRRDSASTDGSDEQSDLDSTKKNKKTKNASKRASLNSLCSSDSSDQESVCSSRVKEKRRKSGRGTSACSTSSIASEDMESLVSYISNDFDPKKNGKSFSSLNNTLRTASTEDVSDLESVSSSLESRSKSKYRKLPTSSVLSMPITRSDSNCDSASERDLQLEIPSNIRGEKMQGKSYANLQEDDGESSRQTSMKSTQSEASGEEQPGTPTKKKKKIRVLVKKMDLEMSGVDCDSICTRLSGDVSEGSDRKKKKKKIKSKDASKQDLDNESGSLHKEKKSKNKTSKPEEVPVGSGDSEKINMWLEKLGKIGVGKNGDKTLSRTNSGRFKVVPKITRSKSNRSLLGDSDEEESDFSDSDEFANDAVDQVPITIEAGGSYDYKDGADSNIISVLRRPSFDRPCVANADQSSTQFSPRSSGKSGSVSGLILKLEARKNESICGKNLSTNSSETEACGKKIRNDSPPESPIVSVSSLQSKLESRADSSRFGNSPLQKKPASSIGALDNVETSFSSPPNTSRQSETGSQQREQGLSSSRVGQRDSQLLRSKSQREGLSSSRQGRTGSQMLRSKSQRDGLSSSRHNRPGSATVAAVLGEVGLKHSKKDRALSTSRHGRSGSTVGSRTSATIAAVFGEIPSSSHRQSRRRGSMLGSSGAHVERKNTSHSSERTSSVLHSPNRDETAGSARRRKSLSASYTQMESQYGGQTTSPMSSPQTNEGARSRRKLSSKSSMSLKKSLSSSHLGYIDPAIEKRQSSYLPVDLDKPEKRSKPRTFVEDDAIDEAMLKPIRQSMKKLHEIDLVDVSSLQPEDTNPIGVGKYFSSSTASPVDVTEMTAFHVDPVREDVSRRSQSPSPTRTKSTSRSVSRSSSRSESRPKLVKRSYSARGIQVEGTAASRTQSPSPSRRTSTSRSVSRSSSRSESRPKLIRKSYSARGIQVEGTTAPRTQSPSPSRSTASSRSVSRSTSRSESRPKLVRRSYSARGIQVDG